MKLSAALPHFHPQRKEKNKRRGDKSESEIKASEWLFSVCVAVLSGYNQDHSRAGRTCVCLTPLCCLADRTALQASCYDSSLSTLWDFIWGVFWQGGLLKYLWCESSTDFYPSPAARCHTRFISLLQCMLLVCLFAHCDFIRKKNALLWQ